MEFIFESTLDYNINEFGKVTLDFHTSTDCKIQKSE